MRLDRFLAETGFGTRTEVKKLIKQGLVTIDGKPSLKPDIQLDPLKATVTVGGINAKYREFIYLMLNKPSGYVSATFDKKLPTVIDLLPESFLHFEPFPVGRLDIDTEGLLLLTNDGALSHKLLSPKNHVPKTYIAELEKPIDENNIKSFAAGITLDDGYTCLPAEVKQISESPVLAEVRIFEGKFHQVKRMFEAIDNKVLYLRRIRMKNLCLDKSLPLGEMRELTEEEICDLKNDFK